MTSGCPFAGGVVATGGLAQRELPSYFPPDTVRLSTYPEVNEVLRRGDVFHLDASYDHTKPLSRGSVFTLSGQQHRERRVMLNPIARPAALKWQKTEVLLPLMQQTLDEVRTGGDTDGFCRVELIALLRRVFLRFTGAILGLPRSTTTEGAEELWPLYEGAFGVYRSRYMTPGDRAKAIEVGLRAKQAFIERFFEPGVAAWHERLQAVAAGALTEEELPQDLMRVMASPGDSDFKDADIAVNELFMFMFAGVDTGVVTLAHAVDELSRWLAAHPEDISMVEDLEFLRRVVTESLRLHPVPWVKSRLCTRQVTLQSSGRTINEGQTVALVFHEANRDRGIWGEGADRFDPRRSVPGVPDYGISFGGGNRQCIGMRIVIGTDERGVDSSHLSVLRMLMQAGVAPDPEHPAVVEGNEHNEFSEYPVVLRALQPAG